MSADPKKFGRIGVLMGGCSSEREISLKSGKAVLHALEEAGCDVLAVELNSFNRSINELAVRKAGIDVGFIALHGVYGEDGQVQELLEGLDIPYVGSGVEASRITIDKVKTQERLRVVQVPISEFCVAKQGDARCLEQPYAMIGQGPVVVKPACEGSSIGVQIVQSTEPLKEAVEQAFQYGPTVLVERYVAGREFTVGILGDKALPVVEIRPKTDFFDFHAKYQKGMTEYIVPAQIDSDLSDELRKIAVCVFRSLGCRDLARVDFIVDRNGKPFVLEVNTIPGFTATSLLPMAAQATGCSFKDLCLRLVGSALERQPEKKR